MLIYHSIAISPLIYKSLVRLMQIISNLGDALRINHTILGIHMMGNEAKVDELGFVIPEKNLDLAACHVFVRIPCKAYFDNLVQKP